jgi:hypothetical protein
MENLNLGRNILVAVYGRDLLVCGASKEYIYQRLKGVG